MRRRYKYDETSGHIMEVGVFRVPVPRVFIETDTPFAGLRATDGSDVSTRQRHRNYMKDHGLALAEDYTETWKKAAEERERDRAGLGRDDSIKEDIAESYEMVRNGYKPKPLPQADEGHSISSFLVGKDV